MASGRLVVISASKIVSPPTESMPSMLMPACVRSCATVRSSAGKSTNSRSQLERIFIPITGLSLKLLKTIQIAPHLPRDNRKRQLLGDKPASVEDYPEGSGAR